MNEAFMQEAIRLAAEGVRSGKGGPFGAVIVENGVIIGRGQNQVTSCSDPTAHAEVQAIRQACLHRGTFHLEGCEIYASCEPCPMCLSAIYWAHLDRIYYAAGRRDAAEAGFDDEFLYQEIARDASNRKIPMIALLKEEGESPFRIWSDMEDRIDY